ncbi:hypothetical protein ALP25_102115 [Pseudomonas syringae pv. syringae]|nr:hypothetical protein ALP25_102115 [Pseudomonas syringae pv. syringae]
MDVDRHQKCSMPILLGFRKGTWGTSSQDVRANGMHTVDTASAQAQSRRRLCVDQVESVRLFSV